MRPKPMLPTWKENALYKKLCDILPDYRTPFNRFDVERLAEDANLTRESVYKWLRNGKLPFDKASLIVTIAAKDKNVAALANLKRPVPTLHDFIDLIG